MPGGVMAWELLAGEHPFASRTTVQAMVVAQLAEPAPSLRAQQPVVPDVLEAVVMQCLAKAPDQRPASAAALLAALDSMLSDAHTALGYVHAEMFEWSAADSELRRAITLDPNNAEPRYRLAYSLMNQGRPADAIPELQRAEADDPRYFLTASYLGWAESEVGREAEGVDEARRGLALEPGNIAALSILATVYNRAALSDSARVYARRIVAVSSQPARLGVAASVLARNGDRKGAEEIVRQLEATPAGTWTRWTALALAYTGLGDTTRALVALEHAAGGDGDALPTYYKVGVLDQLPPGPRLDAVLRRYHLDPPRVATRRDAVRP